MNLIAAWPRMMSTEEATAYAGGPTIFADLLRKDLLEPREQRKGLTRYDRLSVDAALDAWKGLDAPLKVPTRRNQPPVDYRRTASEGLIANVTKGLLNGKQLAKAMNVPEVFVTAMKARGYVFPYQHQTTLEHALKWRKHHPHFRYSDYVDEHRKSPKQLPTARSRKR